MAFAGAVYARTINNRELTFGVSGLLYKSNLLMYDHQTESLWLQVKRKAVTGPLTGAKLKTYPSTVTTWAKWKKRYPKTEVLSLDTGHIRDYSRDPYASYYKSKRGLFSFLRPKPGADEKELIVGVTVEKESRAYPLRFLRKNERIADMLSGENIQIQYDSSTDKITIQTASGKTIDFIITYWLVWHNIYPDAEIFRFDGSR